MQCFYNQKLLLWLSFIISFIISSGEAHASHAQGADITYRCLGGNQYQITLSFYRDCGGVNAPNNVSINISSASCNQNYNITLNQVPNTGQEVTPICPNVLTECAGGNIPGVQEWIYRGVTTLPAQCTDWVFSFTLCCRNAAITTIQNPGGENIYVTATLDNLNYPCNNSPTFSNRPIPYVCIGQTFCFNNGGSDVDGDSLAYQLITPQTGPTTTVTYIQPYSMNQPLSSSPGVSFNPVTGDMCMSPTQLEVTVFAILVKEYRNGNLVGTVIRDVQLHTMVCSNNLPYIDGINGTNTYSMNGCAGQVINFITNSYDADQNQNVTITWNNGITNATFTSSGGSRPIGTFNWMPTIADISLTPHCFTVTVTDDNCPYNGSQTYAFCITISGLNVIANSNPTTCGASNGTAAATVVGGSGPFTYQWLPSGGTNANATGLTAGSYTINVTDANGCIGADTITIINNGVPATLSMVAVNVNCFGGNNGSVTVNPVGGQQPYTYLWNTNATTQTIVGLTAGNYSVIVTTAQGCISTATIVITQPTLLTTSSTQVDALCFGANNGSATVTPSGGTGPYSFLWNNNQTTATINNLFAGNYFCTVTDSRGCTSTINIQINQPALLQVSITSTANVLCNGGNTGSATILSVGGTAPYTYAWNTTPVQTNATATGLSAGSYLVVVTDANGCTGNITAAIAQPSPIIANLTAVSVSCFGGSNGSITANVTGGNSPYNYVWNSNPQQFTQTASNLITGSYTVVITDANACSINAAITISQPAPLVSSIGNIINVSCNGGNNGSAVGNTTGGTQPYSYSWNTIPVQLTQNVTGLVAGNYTVYVTDGHGCSTSSPLTITQPAPMIVVATGNDTICPGQFTTITANATGGNGGYTYFWNQNLGFGATHVVNPGSTTTYVVTTTDNMGCTAAPQSVTIAVFNLTPTNVVIPPPPAICAGSTTSFTATVNGLTGPVTYSWSNNLGNTPGPINVTPQQTTTYTLYVTNSCGIQVAQTVTVVVNPLPVISLTPQNGTGCGRTMLNFADGNSNANIGSSYSWNFGDGHTSTQVNPWHYYTASGTYIVTLVVTSPAGCSTTLTTTASVIVNPSPAAEFTADPWTATNVTPFIHFNNQTTNANYYSWDFGDGYSSLQLNPTHTYTATGIYTVTLYTSNQYGCMDTVSHTITIEPEFTYYIPNAFTPNEDGKNDVFNGKGQEIIEFDMMIFDRWGEMIYRTDNINKGWDGRANDGDEVAQNGVYVYKITLRDFKRHQHFYDGHFSLIK